MNTGVTRYLRRGLGAAALLAVLLTSPSLLAADGYVPFDGPKTTWHEGFDRYDFVMDDVTGAITPMLEPKMVTAGTDQVLELRARSRTGSAIKALMNLAPPTARQVAPEGDHEVPLDQVKVGDWLRVVPGPLPAIESHTC